MTAATKELLWITAIAAAAGGFMGAFGFWVVTKIESWWKRPQIRIEFGPDYPFQSEATFGDGQKAEFIRVRVKNDGRGTAKRCKCFVRHIALNRGGHITRLPSDELMLTSWVPREAKTTIINIPSGLDFLADLAFAVKVNGGYKVAPIFNVQNRNVSEIFDHVGDFELR